MDQELKQVGRPTKYSEELAQKIACELSHSTVRDVCHNNGLSVDTYYSWLYKYDEFSELSTKARKIRAIKHFNACEDILEKIASTPPEKLKELRADILRLQIDFHLRLAGKAGQGLFTEDKSKDVSALVTHNIIDTRSKVSDAGS